MLADNEVMLKLLDELGQVRTGEAEAGAVQVTVKLPDSGLGHLRRLLRALARGELRPFTP